MSSLPLAALNVVANHLEGTEIDTLRKRNLMLEKNLRALQNQTHAHEEWYCDLVWAARSDGEDERVLIRGKYEGAELDRMERELAQVSSQVSPEVVHWHHGFNSGMLAASRLYKAFAHAGTQRSECFGEDSDEEGEPDPNPDGDRENALEFFPMLDTP